MTGLSASQQAIFAQAATRWSQVITGDLPNATYQGQIVDDVLIAASAVPIDGVNGILGQAAPDAFRGGTFLPYHGFMQFDTADLAAMQAKRHATRRHHARDGARAGHRHAVGNVQLALGRRHR